MTTVQQVLRALDEFSPTEYQESYDNSGLLCGNYHAEVKKILVTLDVTETVLEEAKQKGCNLVVAHHPILFKPIKKITGKNYVERCIMYALKNDINILAMHTNLDNVSHGVNYMIGNRLGLKNIKILSPKNSTLQKLTVFVPEEHVESVSKALHEHGAGNIGNYVECSFRTEGTGTFKPTDSANPYSGSVGVKEYAKETKIEVIVPTPAVAGVLKAMHDAHPYEEVAYFLYPLHNVNQNVGSGMYGTLPEYVPTEQFLQSLKKTFGVPLIKHSKLVKENIQKVAFCGGSGSFLIQHAKAIGAEVYITSDLKYHDFFDAEDTIILVDVGHYESEQFTKELLQQIISKKITNIAVLLSEVVTNPVQYI